MRSHLTSPSRSGSHLLVLRLSRDSSGSFRVLFVLAWVCHFIFEDLNELVEKYCQHRTSGWPNPYQKLLALNSFADCTVGEAYLVRTVYPMLGVKCLRNDTWSKAPRWIQAAASIENADEFSNEECKTNTHRRDERRFVLLFGQPIRSISACSLS
jgi:hypothetical protein